MALTINDILKQRTYHGFPAMISHPRGWNDIVLRLHNNLMDIEPNYTVVQTKEKFGVLRFYVKLPDDISEERFKAAYATIDKATAESSRTCENCGKPGRRRNGSWVRTLCDRCHREQP
jgi:hypothetical protein